MTTTPIIFAVYFTGWVNVIAHVVELVLLGALWWLRHRERRLRRTWAPIVTALQRAVDAEVERRGADPASSKQPPA